MPDRYGRFNFADGAAIASTVYGIKDREEKKKKENDEKKLNDEIFNATSLLQEGKPLPDDLSPEARYKAADKHFDIQLKDYDTQIKKHYASDIGRKEKLAEIEALNVKAGQLFKQYQAARRSGDDAMARQIGIQFNNEIAYNGIHVKPLESGKLHLTKSDRSTEDIDDLPIEQYDELITGYMGMSGEELLKLQLGGEQYRSQHNQNILSQRETMINDKGDIIYRIPAGSMNKATGEYMDEFYIRSLADETLLSAEEVKKGGYMPVKDMESRNKQKKQPMERAKLKAEADKAKGGSSDGTKDDAARRKKFKEDLDLALKPFAGSKPIVDEDTGKLTREGRTALDAAIILVTKYDNKEELTPDEKKKIKHAIRAVEIHNKISDVVYAGYSDKKAVSGSWKDYR